MCAWWHLCNHTQLRVFSQGKQIYPDFSMHKKDCLKECFEFLIFSAFKIHAVCVRQTSRIQFCWRMLKSKFTSHLTSCNAWTLFSSKTTKPFHNWMSMSKSDFQNLKKSSSWFRRLLSKYTKHEEVCTHFCVLLRKSDL